jgi:hypothetical protein
MYEALKVKINLNIKKRAAPGFEPGTSYSRSKNHTTRPSSLTYLYGRILRDRLRNCFECKFLMKLIFFYNYLPIIIISQIRIVDYVKKGNLFYMCIAKFL